MQSRPKCGKRCSKLKLVSQDLAEGQHASVLAALSGLVHNLQTRRRLSEPVLNAALRGFIVQYIALLNIQMWLMQATASYCNTCLLYTSPSPRDS